MYSPKNGGIYSLKNGGIYSPKNGEMYFPKRILVKYHGFQSLHRIPWV